MTEGNVVDHFLRHQRARPPGSFVVSQSLTRRVKAREARCTPSGLKAMPSDPLGVSLDGAQQVAGGDVPEGNGLAERTARGEGLAVGRKRQLSDGARL